MRDEWSGLADLLGNLIAKYASVIDTDSVVMPKERENSCDHEKLQERKTARESITAGSAADDKDITKDVEESIERRSSA